MKYEIYYLWRMAQCDTNRFIDLSLFFFFLFLLFLFVSQVFTVIKSIEVVCTVTGYILEEPIRR